MSVTESKTKTERKSSRKPAKTQETALSALLAQTEDVFQKDIEEEYSIRPSTATELLKQMEKNGLIVREPASYDNRLKRIVVTEKALQYRQQVVEDLTALEETLIRGIPENNLEIFFQVIEKMMDNLAE